jgi:hypothetical protein
MEMYVTLISGSLCTDNEFPECILKAKKKKKKNLKKTGSKRAYATGYHL